MFNTVYISLWYTYIRTREIIGSGINYFIQRNEINWIQTRITWPTPIYIIRLDNLFFFLYQVYSSSSSSISRPGMYSKLTSKTTGLFAATLGLPGAEVRPLGNANCDCSKWRGFTRFNPSHIHVSLTQGNIQDILCYGNLDTYWSRDEQPAFSTSLHSQETFIKSFDNLTFVMYSQ